jgi:hypothetical protein
MCVNTLIGKKVGDKSMVKELREEVIIENLRQAVGTWVDGCDVSDCQLLSDV